MSRDRMLTELSDELSRTPPEVGRILVAATSAMSRLAGSTWIAVLMNPDPDTSRVVAADDADPAMKAWIDSYLAAIGEPHRIPTSGVSRQVIESGRWVLERLPYDRFLSLLTVEGQAFVRDSPPPGEVRTVEMLVVPMRTGDATIGTLGMLDGRSLHPIVEADVGRVQAAADRIALSLEHARLLASVRDGMIRMDIIRDIALVVRLSPDLAPTLNVISGKLMKLPEVDALDIMLLTEDGRELEIASSAGHQWPSPPPQRRVPASWAWPDMKPSRPEVDFLASLDRKKRNPRRSRFAQEGFRTVVGVPLFVGARSLGVIELYSRGIVEWGADRLELLDTIGALVAVAIDRATEGRSPGVTAAFLGPHPPDFTQLELEILRLVLEGFTNREIATQVHRSDNTIKFHVRRILEKAGAVNRTELARRATREGWL